MLATVHQANLNRATIGSLAVGQLGIGPIQIGQLVLDSLDVAMAAGVAQLTNFRVTITLDIALDWHVHIGLPLGLSIDRRGHVTFDRTSFMLALGNVTVPGLQNLSLHVDTTNAANVAMVVQPLTNLMLGGAVAEQIQATNVAVPSGGFQIAGLAISGVQADGIAVPAAGVDKVAIAHVHGDGTGVGSVVIPGGLSLPHASVSDVVSQAVDASATEAAIEFSVTPGFLDLTLSITPSARAQADRLEITNISGDVSVGRLELHDVVAPYELLNLTLAQIGIESVEVPTLSVR
jgi:hypothetical protein